MSDYQTQLDAWKSKHGIGGNVNHAEIRMMNEEMNCNKTSWCNECDKHMPIMEMELITRAIDPYRQMFEGPGDYIPFPDRVRMCPECFALKYPKQP